MSDDKGKEAKMLCVFCGNEWTDDMVQIYDLDASEGCPSCGHGGHISGTVEIRCKSCSRLIYKKEFSNNS